MRLRFPHRPRDMHKSKLQTRLEAGRQVPGLFAPAEADFVTPGVLSWSGDAGATLELVDLSHPWPTSFEETLTIHGKPYDGEALTLLDARVRTRSAFDRTSRLSSTVLAVGAHITEDEKWPVANFRPGTLHEWLPETGLSIDHPDDEMSRLIVEWNAPQ